MRRITPTISLPGSIRELDRRQYLRNRWRTTGQADLLSPPGSQLQPLPQKSFQYSAENQLINIVGQSFSSDA
jgi:hypothetical protein